MPAADAPIKTFDFVIVGGGTAGCFLAHELASRGTQPSVLLIEAGGPASGITYRSPAERYHQAFSRTELDHGYSTTPQAALNGRCLSYPRGKGLGGSSLINFMVYTTGAAADYDHWAKLVGDEDWRWEKTSERFKKIENFHYAGPKEASKYSDPLAEHHGTNGPVDVSLPPLWEVETAPAIEAAMELGLPLNLDINSGNPVGIGISTVSMANGLRTTSASASKYPSKLQNLTVLTDTIATRVLFEGEEARGVETSIGTTVYASKEIILSAGAIDTPKLLLLSGIGPAKELEALGLKVVNDLPGVGKNLQDHAGLCLLDIMEPTFSVRPNFRADGASFETAREQWIKDQTGPMASDSNCGPIAFIKDPALNSSIEFKNLDNQTKEYINQPTCPNYEVYINGPAPPPTIPLPPNSAYLSTFIMNMNPQSHGTVTLASASPTDPPLIDVNYATHPFDKKTLIHAIRAAMQLPKTKALGKYWKGPLHKPGGGSDNEIWEFIKQNLQAIWHANGTVKMGKPSDKLACVEPDLKVRGLRKLRVADLSVCPLTPSGHTQAPAYLIGAVAAEKIIDEWGL